MSSAAAAIKRMIGAVAISSPLRPLMNRHFRARANIVYYHFVGRTEPFYKEFSGQCSLDRFEQDLRLLKSRFDLVPLQRVVELCRHGETPRIPVLAITFDDGFNLVRSGVMEVLDRHGVKATVFLITSCIDNQNLMWRNKISAMKNSLPSGRFLATYNRVAEDHGIPSAETAGDVLRQSMCWPMARKEALVDAFWAASAMPPLADYLDQYRPYMSWDDLEIWRSHGHDVGLHTRTHPVCAELDEPQIAEEIIEPAAFLKNRYGLTNIPFSYPFGIRLPEAAERQVMEADILQCACGIQGNVLFGTSLRRLERVGVERAVAFPLFGKALIKAWGAG